MRTTLRFRALRFFGVTWPIVVLVIAAHQTRRGTLHRSNSVDFKHQSWDCTGAAPTGSSPPEQASAVCLSDGDRCAPDCDLRSLLNAEAVSGSACAGTAAELELRARSEPGIRSCVLEMLRDRNARVRAVATLLAGILQPDDDFVALLCERAVSDEDASVRIGSLLALTLEPSRRRVSGDGLRELWSEALFALPAFAPFFVADQFGTGRRASRGAGAASMRQRGSRLICVGDFFDGHQCASDLNENVTELLATKAEVDADRAVRSAAIGLLGHYRDRDWAATALERIAMSSSDSLRAEAVRYINPTMGRVTPEMLSRWCEDDDSIALIAIEKLGELHTSKGTRLLETVYFNSARSRIRSAVLESFPMRKESSELFLMILHDALRSDDPKLQLVAIRRAGTSMARSTKSVLRSVATEARDSRVREAAGAAAK